MVINYRNNKIRFDLRKNILSTNKQNIDFNTSFQQYKVTAFRVYSILTLQQFERLPCYELMVNNCFIHVTCVLENKLVTKIFAKILDSA